MARQIQTFREADLGGGIDQQSSENNIAASFSEKLENTDPLPTGQLRTRKGHEGYLGYVPIRVKRIEYKDDATDNLCIYLDGSIELTTVDLTTSRKSPIILLGKTSHQNTNDAGDFPYSSESIHWYPTFTTEILKTFLAGTNTLLYPQDEHTLSSSILFVGTASADSQLDTSNSQFMPDSVVINKTTADISIGYTNGTGSAFDGYVFLSNQQAVAGDSYVSAPTAVPVGTQTISISAATHGLNNFNIIPEFFVDDGTNYTRVIPDSFVVDNAGNTTTTLTNNTGSTFNLVIVLAAAPISNVVSGSVAADTTMTVVIPNIETSFVFATCYLEQTLGGNFEQILPDSIVTDATVGTTTITFVNGTSTGKNFEVYYKFVNIATNKLCVDASVILTADEFTDTVPQLTLYGIPHAELYGEDRQPREGWVSHIDSYRSVEEDRLISGLGGNIFSAQLRSEGANATNYLMPLYYPDLRSRILADQTIGPTFIDSSDTSTRTRGYIQADTAGNNFLEIDSATFDTGTGYLVYRLLAPSLAIVGTLSTIISTISGMEDYLLVQQMGYSRLNGSYKIRAVTAGIDYLDVSVENDNIDSSDYNELDAGGKGGIFSDQLVFNSQSPFIPNDLLNSSLFSDYTVLTSSGTISVVDDIIDEVALPSGLRVVASRTGRVIPLRESDGTQTVENLVRGDMLLYSPIKNRPRITAVRPESNTALTITADGADATVTLGAGDTNNIKPGDYILVRESAEYSGEHLVTAVPSLTTFQFSTTKLLADTGLLIGHCITIDEELTIEDKTDSSNTVQVEGRWIPIEAPEDNYDLTPFTYIHHFDSNAYTDQPILRSVMVQDNLYFANGSDEIMKFDGASIYRAGLFRWQANLFLTKDTTSTGVIVLDNPTISYTANAANHFTISTDDQLVYQKGEKIEDSSDGIVYTITDIGTDGTDAFIYVDRTINHATGAGSLTKIATFRYYARLNMIDINNNLIASAVVGSDDTVVEIGADAAVRLRAIGMATIDNYDYDRLEVQWYRTQANSQAPYYLLTTQPMSFNSNDGYIDYIDTAVDSDLIELDAVSTVLEGAELGTGFSDPIRAKYVTTAENRLLLANITDYPSLDLQITENGDGPISIADLTNASNRRWLFRKDNTDTLTTTDMVNRLAIEFVDIATAAKTIVPATDLSTTGTNEVNVAYAAHGLTAGDWVYLFHSAVQDANLLTFAGWFQVSSVPDVNNFRFNDTNARAGTAQDVDRFLTATTKSDVPVGLGTDGNYAMVNGNRDTSLIPNYQFLAMRRAANALNCAMRKTDTTITVMSEFRPWMVANAGNEFNSGELLIKQPVVLPTTMELLIPALSGAFDVFVNSVKRSGTAQAGSIERLFPSRVISSYQNFPEIFDRPTVESDIDSKSASDINPADGQEVTSIVPFFGDTAFGAALQGSIVTTFKENSIYLLNTALKFQGQQSVQKLETQGKGCTAPFSVASTKDGIMFANDSGIYRLNKNLSIDYVGRKYERLFLEGVNRDQLAIATGHHFANGNQYKLSLPSGDSTQLENNEVAVYNHTREYESQSQMGSWCTYSNIAATGWANLLTNAFFATTDGQVYKLRNVGDTTDYRDDASPIEWEAVTRAWDFGDSGIRKYIDMVITHYRNLVEVDSASLNSAVDLQTEFEPTDQFSIQKSVANTNLSDTINKKVVSIRSSLETSMCLYLQLQYLGSCYDTPVEIAGIDIRVAGVTSEGITEAAQTTGGRN